MVKTTTTLRSSKKYYTHDQIFEALQETDERLERCQLNYFLLEDLAQQVFLGSPQFKNLEEITLGVRERDWTTLSKSLMRSIGLKDLMIEEDSIEFKNLNGVPTVIWIIHRNYEFFKRPDLVWHSYTQFRVPNPFAKYWKARFLIK